MKKNVRGPISRNSCFVLNIKRINLSILVTCLVSAHCFAGGTNNELDNNSIFNEWSDKGHFALPITGKILDDKGEPLNGASIVEKGTNNTTLSKADGSFSITVADENAKLVISYIGFEEQQVSIKGSQTVMIRLMPFAQAMDSVIIVGYGRQRKESVVAAITQTTGAVLQRAGGVSNIGAALTGNVPGVITIQGTGLPGAEDPAILIRGVSTWNGSAPLILVDGIERAIGGVDVASVESISILKDASATAVFGIKGAQGVILITTKRGAEGKAAINAIVNVTSKIPSRLPQKYDSYDALSIRNLAIERELAVSPASWADYTPFAIIDKYRNPANAQEAQRYPNVDWQEESLKNMGMAYNANFNISGGSSAVKYYTAIDILHEGDIMKVRDNGKGYKPGFFYDRLNLRSNLDFKLTKTTTLTANLSTLFGNRQDSYSGFEYSWYQSIYGLAPDLFYPQYADGSWGYYPLDPVSTNNSSQILSNNGVRNSKSTQINTDFSITQNLGMLVKNLTFKALFSLDNRFSSTGGVFDDGSAVVKYIYPDGTEQYRNTAGSNQFDYMVPLWSVRADAFNNGATARQKVYQLQLNHSAKFGRHNLTTMGLFMRNENAQGNQFSNRREDWVFRSTYNYDSRYFAEVNGAYNGSDQFGPNFRFDFYPSAAIGWTVTNEKFMDNVDWLTNLKIRGSYGLVGSDGVPSYRGAYLNQWSFGGQVHLGDAGGNNSPYVWYRETGIGNPDLRWEKVAKRNIGLEYSLFKGLIEGSFDVFKDERVDIFIPGNGRSVPVYFGGPPPAANLGKAEVAGYEIELKFNKRFGRDWRVWSNLAMSHAKDKIIDRDDPLLLDDYQKQAGYQLGQYRSQISTGYYSTWDQLYGSVRVNADDAQKLPGNFNLLDFNGDGLIDNYDNVPYAYPERPQNTYTGTFGFDFKRLSFMVQFYAVNNVTRNLTQTNFSAALNSVFVQGDYWSKDNVNAQSPLPRWKSRLYSYGDFFNYDGSYVRLKTAEISYTLNPTWLKKAGIKNMRLYVNGNNLLLWSKMPDDREANIGSSNFAGQGAYPTVRRINLGLNLSL